ncbi:unnamed protein product [Camellia sinensis]
MASKKKPNKALNSSTASVRFHGTLLSPKTTTLSLSLLALVNSRELSFLSLEEIDESEYGLEIPKPERENKKQRTKENKNEKKRKHSEVEDELGGEVEAVSEEKDNKVKRKKKKKKKKKKNKDAKNSEENEEPTAEVNDPKEDIEGDSRYWDNTLSIPRGVDHGPPSVNSPEPCSRELVRIRLYDTVNTGSVFFVVSELQEIAPGITSVFFFSSYVLQATFTDILKQLGCLTSLLL